MSSKNPRHKSAELGDPLDYWIVPKNPKDPVEQGRDVLNRVAASTGQKDRFSLHFTEDKQYIAGDGPFFHLFAKVGGQAFLSKEDAVASRKDALVRKVKSLEKQLAQAKAALKLA